NRVAKNATVGKLASGLSLTLTRHRHDSVYPSHVWEGHPEQRTASLSHRRWHQCARQLRPACDGALSFVWRRHEQAEVPATAQSFPASRAVRPGTRPLLAGPHATAVLS